MIGKGAPSLRSPVRSCVVGSVPVYIRIISHNGGVVGVCASERATSLLQSSQLARVNYEHSLLTKRSDLINSYYNYAIATYEDYVRAYNAFYGQTVQKPSPPNSNQVYIALQQDPGNIAQFTLRSIDGS